uniref:Capsid protein n=1 Tax=Barns Ness serrated wrack noda-like virus 2 TaxID=2021921 RepID=A0A221LFP3_9VIRU|nr:putative capsid [Barns Ness serrated wrack noda-like virus 2]
MSPRNRTRKPGAGNKPVPVANRPAAQRTTELANVPFRGTERLTSVTGGEANFIKTFHLNPGLQDTFSVGHFQAQNYDKYLLTGRNSVRYTPACSTLTTGSVYILIDYDPTDRAPSTEEEFADNELTMTCPTWGKMSAPIQASRMDNCRKLIRTGPTVESKLLTDACAIHIGAFGFGDTIGIGHIHIDYSAKLFVRQPSPTSLPLPRNTLALVPAELVVSTDDAVIFSSDKFNTLGTVTDGNNVVMKRGVYLVDVRLGFNLQASTPNVFLSAEIRRNGIRIGQSPVVFSESGFDAKSLSLVSNGNIVQFREGDIFSVHVFHDHNGTVSIIADRSLVTARLV